MHNNLLVIAHEQDMNVINTWLNVRNHAPLVKLNNSIFEREKAFTFNTYGGAYKEIFGEGFIDLLDRLDWYLPEQVVVIYGQNGTDKEDEIGIWKKK